MNIRLSRRFGHHPGVILWHISNEYNGACYCPLCQEAFRDWLKNKYGSIKELNHQWWTAFWSHTYTSFDQIDPPLLRGENMVHGLVLDWKRFVTQATVDFFAWEKQAIRDGGSDIPVTTNLMGFYEGLNYFKFRDVLDIVSWDNYPFWHKKPEDESGTAIRSAAAHDLMRCIKQEAFLMMESVPGVTNWHPVCRMKKPGMHQLSSLQAIAHGSNSVQYFQWRKSRGSSEKFHGAVVGHDQTGNTRIFKEVSQLGQRLEGLSKVCETGISPEVAIIYDWENRWALDQMQGLLNGRGIEHENEDPKHYIDTILDHYAAFWHMGIPVDIIDMSCKLDGYKLVIAPMLYMYREGIEDKLRRFVEEGGCLMGTYWSGLVNENDLCYESYAPYGLQDVYGLYSEEIDALYPDQTNKMILNEAGTLTGFNEKEKKSQEENKGEYKEDAYILYDICDIVNLTTAQSLASYQDDYYQGRSALTLNSYGKGKAYYLSARAEGRFYQDFYDALVRELGIERSLGSSPLPHGVTANIRKKDGNAIIIVQNYNNHPLRIKLEETLKDLESGEITRQIELEPYGVRIFIKQ